MPSRRSSRSLSLRLASAPLLVGALVVHALAGCSADSSTAPSEASSPSASHTASASAINGRYSLLSKHLTTEMQNAPRIGPVPRSTPMSLTLGLPSDLAAIRAAVARVMDPSGPDYRKFITPEQFAERFGASDADYQAVVAWARAKGFTVTPHRGRLAVDVQGTSGDVEDAFAVQMVYAQRTDGSQFYAPDREPTIDLVIPLDVIGNMQVYHPFILPILTNGSGIGGAIQGKDLQTAYTKGSTMDGTGQSIGIFMLDDFSIADVTTYMGLVSLPVPPASNFSSVPANSAGTPNTTKDATYGWSEGDTDVELALTMAPAAHIVAFTGTSIDTILNNMADAPNVSQLFSSWSINDLDTSGQSSVNQFALQGQAFFVGSGDLGAYPLTGTNPNVNDFTPSAGADLRQQQGVTVVGGTTLVMNSDGSTSETAWIYPSGSQSFASGGGFAPFAATGAYDSNATPSYQASFVSANANGASSTYRNFPDVSAAAQNVSTYTSGQLGAGAGGQWVPQSGTGVATAIWAGFIALANQQSTGAGQPAVTIGSSLGAINPEIYALAQGNQYAANFTDVTSGTNPSSSVSTGAPITPAFSYSAGTGYDLTTGLGSPKAALIGALSNLECTPKTEEEACGALGHCGVASDGCGGTFSCYGSCSYDGDRCVAWSGIYACRPICTGAKPVYCNGACYPTVPHLICPIPRPVVPPAPLQHL